MRPRRRNSFSRAARLIRLGLGLGASASVYMLFEAQWLRFVHKHLRLPSLPPGLAGLRLLHVSDLHAGVPGPNHRAIVKFVDAALGSNPDMILFTGDMTDKKRDLRPHLALLSQLHAPLGKFAVLGNHDHGLRKTVLMDLFNRATGRSRIIRRELEPSEVKETVALNRRLLARAGIQLLENDCARVSREGNTIQVCGIDEFQYGLSDMDAVLARLDRKAELRILLSHAPDVIAEIGEGEFQLVLSGHTHGGQICVPHPTRGKVLLSSSGSQFAYGLYQYPGTVMHVSRGVGTTLVPFRLLSRPEITLLELDTAP